MEPTVLNLIGVSWDLLQSPEGFAQAAEMFSYNESILFPQLRWGRNLEGQDKDTGRPAPILDSLGTSPQENVQ
jgi:hypothetical protein